MSYNAYYTPTSAWRNTGGFNVSYNEFALRWIRVIFHFPITTIDDDKD